MNLSRLSSPAQEEINFDAPISEPPDAKPEEVSRMTEILKGNGWMTAEQIAAKMEGASERKVRKIASAAAPNVVSFPGSPGYRLWADCSVDEINHAIEAFEDQAKEMFKRANLYRQAYHARYRGAAASVL